ncbi:MAG TPA: ABC transporter permease [Fibrobacteria bacterium]|nr:ABC transporter permease [Fibrobacteria bacterium]HOX50505.1 ABC transporter permease [Fibrobacteria bacterium]
MNLQVVGAFVRKELSQILRDPRMRGITMFMPVVQLLLLVSAARLDLQHAPVAILDLDRTSESRGLAQRVAASPFFEVRHDLSSHSEVEPLLREGRVVAVLEIPGDFARELAAGRTAEVGVILDGSDANTAGLVGNYLSGIAQDMGMSRLMVRQRKLLGEPAFPGVELRSRVWFNPELESKWFMVPAVLAMTIFLTTIMASSNAIAKEREIGTLEQLVVTPLRGWELAIGKVAPYFLTSTFVVTLVLVSAWLVFGVKPLGSLLQLYPAVWLFLFSSLGIGLLISTFARTQQQAMVVASFFMMPLMIYLSGFTFPIRNMPTWLQNLTYLIPLRYFLVLIRGIYLKGTGFMDLWQQWAMVAGYGIGVMGLAIWRLDRQLR